MHTINAYLEQKNIEQLKKMMFIVVDGKVKTRNQKITNIPGRVNSSTTMPNTKQTIEIEIN